MKTIVTKITVALFALMMVASLASCGKKPGKGDVYRYENVEDEGDGYIYREVAEIRFLNDKDVELWEADYYYDDEEEEKQLELSAKGTYTVDKKALKVRFLIEGGSSVVECPYAVDLSVIVVDGQTFKKVSK